MNIEPGEEFKASRFVGDKLYLVTFEQIDPLFVIDLADLKNPKIVGELKIPWFSTYLHPYSVATNGVQQLIGVGYDTEVNQWGGTVTKGVKVDVYTVDYTKKDDAGNIAVSQTATATFGGKWSDSEVLQNPRLFVWNESKKQLIMPMVLQTASIGKQCSIVYDADGKVAHQECRDNEIYKTTFAWTKILSVLPDKISEAYSYDFKDLLKQDKQAYGDRQGEIWPWHFSQQQFRVGYLGDVVYTLSNMFGHFALPVSNQEVYLEFDPTVDVP